MPTNHGEYIANLTNIHDENRELPTFKDSKARKTVFSQQWIIMASKSDDLELLKTKTFFWSPTMLKT